MPAASRHRGGHRRQHRGHRGGENTKRDLRSRHRAGICREGRPARHRAGTRTTCRPPGRSSWSASSLASSTTWCARERSAPTWPRSTCIRLGGTWKKPGTSDIEIVCAEATGTEWCAPPARRRTAHRLRYESEVSISPRPRQHAIVGVAVDNGDADGGDGLQVVPPPSSSWTRRVRTPRAGVDVSVLAPPEAEQDITLYPRCSTARRSGGGRTR